MNYKLIFSILLFAFIAGCSSNPTEDEIFNAVHSHYNSQQCDSMSMDVKLKNTLPGKDSNRLILDLEVERNFKGDPEKLKNIEIFYKEKFTKLKIDALHKIASVSNDIHLNMFINDYKFKAIDDTISLFASSYAHNCSKKTIDTLNNQIKNCCDKNIIDLHTEKNIKKIINFDDYYSIKLGESIKIAESVNLTVVKSKNGWVLDLKN